MNRDRLRVTVDGEAFEMEPGPAPKPADTSDRDALVIPLPLRDDDRTAGRRRYEVVVDGWRFEAAVESAFRATLRDRAQRAGAAAASTGQIVVRAQIPGRVVRIWAAAGDRVEAGQRLLSVEAMKMENEVRTPRAGTVARVATAAGERVELGDELVVIE